MHEIQQRHTKILRWTLNQMNVAVYKILVYLILKTIDDKYSKCFKNVPEKCTSW